MPDGDEVQFKSPTSGAVQTIPPEHWDEALSQGYKPVTHKVMYSPEGQRGMVPNGELADRMHEGYQTTPKTPFETERDPKNRPGFFSNLGTAAKNLAGGILNQPTNAAEAALAGGRMGGQVAQEDIQRKQEGRSPAYRATAAMGSALGIPARQMEEAADVGDTSGIIGAATPITAATLAPSIASRIPWAQKAAAGRTALSEFVRDPATGRVRSPWDLAIDKIAPDPYAPQSIPAKAIPKGTNYGQYLENQKLAAKAPPPEPELGSAENPGPFSKIPTKLPTALRGDPFAPSQPAPPSPFSAPMEAQSAEGVPGYVPKPSGRMVRLPQEFAAQDQLQGFAKTRASERGMQFAAGMVPAEGRAVPRTPTKINTVEFPTRGNASPFSPAAPTPALKMETDSLGIRWAVSPDGYRVSIPRTVPDAEIAAYAGPKLAEQAEIHSSPWMKAQR